MFTEQERPRAIGIWAAANSIGFPLGPIVGGWLLDHFWWGSVFLINVPVIAVALLAVTLLLPESSSAARPRLDLAGIVASSLGLVGLTYGVIEAGERGWGNPGTIATLSAGVLVLAWFVGWQRRVSQPLVDLSLFRSASFTWATVLATLVSFAMFGVLFTMPQFFQAVIGADAFGTGLRLLPVIGGLLVGVRIAGRLAPRLGAKATVAVGFALLALALLAGATTSVESGYGFTAAWLAVVGVGLGFALPSAMNAALGALSPERSGVGSALIMALRQVGGTIGVAILGTVLSSSYHARLHLDGLPAEAAAAVRRSASAGVAVAHQLGSAPLLHTVRAAFVHGMDSMLWVCGGIALLGVVLTMAFLPRRSATEAAAEAGELQSADELTVTG